MPIYAYKCASCGHAKDVLQKMSDPALSECPACGQSTFSKQLTAAGFQLKGSGWYATDFRGGAAAGAAAATAGESAAASDSATSSAPASTDSASPTAATACGSACACH